MTSSNSDSDLSTSGPLGNEPVLISHLVTVVLTALVGYGWVTIPDHTIDTIASVAGVVIATAGAFLARSRVSPTGRITWDGVRQQIESALYAEIDRLLAIAPAGSYTAAGAAVAEAVTPAPVEATQALPVVTSAPPASIPLGTFTTSTGFAPEAAAAAAPAPAPAPVPDVEATIEQPAVTGAAVPAEPPAPPAAG
jgi:hypothetical protein